MKRYAFFLLLAALLGLSAPARSDTLQLNTFAYTLSSNMRFNVATPQGTDVGVRAGGMSGTLNGKSFLTYCVDIFQGIYLGTSYSSFSLVNPNSSLLPWFTTTKATDLGRLFSGYNDRVTDAVSSTAFQIAAWAIVSETVTNYTQYRLNSNGFNATAYDTSGTNLTAEQSALALADNWLQNLPSNNVYRIQVEYSATEQDQVVANKVPEPASFALAASALALLTLMRRRRLAPVPLSRRD